MPKQTRYKIKQDLITIDKELIKASLKMSEIQAMYSQDGHQDIVETIEPYIAITAVTLKFFQAFSNEV